MELHKPPYIVGITGGSATGKTRFLHYLEKMFQPRDLCLISQDNYYKPLNEQPVDSHGVHNFDTPGSIDFQAFSLDLMNIRQGLAFTRQEYTFNNASKVPAMLTFHPAPIIIVEGIFVFYYTELSSQLDLKVYIDAREAIKLKRRIIRDNVERGYDLDDVLYRYEHHVTPTFEKYIAPYRHDADVIIPNNSDFMKGLNVLASHLRSEIAARRSDD